MANLTPVTITAGGTQVDLTAADPSDTILNASGATLRVNNGSGADITVTFTGVNKCSDGFLHDTVITVTAGKEKDCPVPTRAVDKSTGSAAVTYSATTSVTRAAVYQ